jgi:hypothetical protein
MAEMPLAGERDDEFKFLDHTGSVGLSPRNFAKADDSAIR